jgi:hypothetical protein
MLFTPIVHLFHYDQRRYTVETVRSKPATTSKSKRHNSESNAPSRIDRNTGKVASVADKSSSCRAAAASSSHLSRHHSRPLATSAASSSHLSRHHSRPLAMSSRKQRKRRHQSGSTEDEDDPSSSPRRHHHHPSSKKVRHRQQFSDSDSSTQPLPTKYYQSKVSSAPKWVDLLLIMVRNLGSSNYHHQKTVFLTKTQTFPSMRVYITLTRRLGYTLPHISINGIATGPRPHI